VAAAFRNRIAICGDNATSFEPFWRRKRRKTNTEKNGRIGEKRASEEERSKKKLGRRPEESVSPPGIRHSLAGQLSPAITHRVATEEMRRPAEEEEEAERTEAAAARRASGEEEPDAIFFDGIVDVGIAVAEEARARRAALVRAAAGAAATVDAVRTLDMEAMAAEKKSLMARGKGKRGRRRGKRKVKKERVLTLLDAALASKNQNNSKKRKKTRRVSKSKEENDGRRALPSPGCAPARPGAPPRLPARRKAQVLAHGARDEGGRGRRLCACQVREKKDSFSLFNFLESGLAASSGLDKSDRSFLKEKNELKRRAIEAKSQAKQNEASQKQAAAAASNSSSSTSSTSTSTSLN